MDQFLAAGLVAVAATTSSGAYPPPPMVNPTVIDLARTRRDWFSFRPDEDVVFMSSDPRHVVTHKVQTQGGRNIRVVGLTMANRQPGSTGTLAFYGLSGQAHVAGVRIDNAAVSGTDGIDIAGGPTTSLVVQDSSIININGARDGGQMDGGNGHADAIQIQGDLGGEVAIRNLQVTTNYQGLFLAPQFRIHPSRIILADIDLRYTGPADNQGNPVSYLLWLNDDPKTEPHVPIAIENVRVEPRPGQQAGRHAVWPTTGSGHAVEQDGRIFFVDLNVTGHVSVGGSRR